MIKHIIKEGSCEHVLWYDNQGIHCSEVNCEINKTKGPLAKTQQSKEVTSDRPPRVWGKGPIQCPVNFK